MTRYALGPSHGPLTDEQVDELARYNARVSEGVVHTAEYIARMRGFQDRWVAMQVPTRRRRWPW